MKEFENANSNGLFEVYIKVRMKLVKYLFFSHNILFVSLICTFISLQPWPLSYYTLTITVALKTCYIHKVCTLHIACNVPPKKISYKQ